MKRAGRSTETFAHEFTRIDTNELQALNCLPKVESEL